MGELIYNDGQPVGHAIYTKTNEKVRINWFRDGKCGYTFESTGGSGVADETEFDWPYGRPQPARERFSLADLDDEELRERLKKVRRERRALMQHKETLSSTKTSKRKRSTVSRKQVETEISKLTDKEKAMLLELIDEKEGK